LHSSGRRAERQGEGLEELLLDGNAALRVYAL